MSNSMTIPLNAPTFDSEEINSAIEVLHSTYLSMGKLCVQFEEEFSKYLGVRNSVFVNSGSSANLLTFFALANHAMPNTGKRQFKAGSEILVPAVTWSTTIWPIVQAGGVPVLVDSDPKTLQMRIDTLEELITDKTVAICPVHVLGNTVDMNAINQLAEKYNLWVIEDTCESLGAKTNNQFVGTLSDMSTFSFFFSHHITTIEGGMICTDNDEIADLLRCLRAHGWTRNLSNKQRVESQYPDIDPRFLFINTGFNVRPGEINAAFGLHQIKKLSKLNQQRNAVVEDWRTFISSHKGSEGIQLISPSAGAEPAWFGFPLICESNKFRNQLQSFLESKGIETRPIICGNMARQPAMKHIAHRTAKSLEGADQIMDRGLFWGSHPMMSKEEVEYVKIRLNDFFNSL